MGRPDDSRPTVPSHPARSVAPIDPGRFERILAVRLDNIGDMLLLGPTFRALREAAPGVSIDVLASPAGTLATELLPWVDEVLTAEVPWQDASGRMPCDPAREQALIAELARRRYDAAFIFTSFSQTPFPAAYACYLAGIPIRVGQARDFGGSVLSHWVDPLPDETHQAERNLHLLDATGIEVADRWPALRVPAEAEGRARTLLEGAGIDPTGPFIAVVPGASCSARRYDATRFGIATASLSSTLGWPTVVLGSGREGELATALMAADPRAISLVGATSVAEFAAVVGRSALMLACNSSAMHIADGVGVPSVILFAGTDEESQWAPRRAPAVLLREPTPCAPCRLFVCPFANACLDIDPAAVIDAALDLVSDNPSKREERWIAYAS